jgi:acylglycerol lipase
MPSNKYNTFPSVDIEHLPYHPALQQMRVKYAPDPASTMQETGYFTTSDGVRLFTRHWFAQDVSKKGVIIAFHGAGGDSEYFVLLADQVVNDGYDVYIHDYQGHGLSEGARGDIKSFSTYVRQAIDFINDVARKIGDMPLFILGESMGGTVVANALAGSEGQQLPTLAGIMLFAPGVKLRASSASFKDVMTVLGMLLSYPFKPGRLTYNTRPVREHTLIDGKETMDPLHFEYDMTNPLHLDRMSSRYTLQLFKAFNRGFNLAPDNVHCPIIVFLGENDLAIDRAGVQDFVERVPEPDKEFVLVPGAPHAMFTHEAYQQYWKKLRDWINLHASSIN